MRPLFIALSFIGAAALACGNPAMSCATAPSGCGPAVQNSCGCNAGQTPILETISYAINELGLSDNGDIRTAIRLYKKEIRSLKPKISTEAFQGGNFNPGAYALNAPGAQALKAEIDLFETIYLILNDEQKKEFPKLMGMYQHHMEFIALPKKLCGTAPGGCGTPARMCDTPLYQGCGAPDCKTPPKKAQKPLKR